MTINVIFFAQLKELTGSGSLELDDVHDTDTLQQRLFARYHGLSDVPFKLAVDREMVEGNTPLKPGAVVALLPPFSGG